MKFLHPGLLFLFLAGQMLGENGFRKFTDIEGREIQARIHNTDGQRVMLETQDGQGFMTTVDVFSLNDQDYIRRWQPKPPEEAEGLEIDESEVEIRQEIYYQIGEQRPYSGVLVSKFVDDTPRATVGLKYGMQHGPTSLWYDAGGKMTQSMFLEGRQHGLTAFWYPSGEKKVESAYENGKQHGLTTFWYKNGQKRVEGLWNQGQRELVHTKWHENGEKMSEITYTWGRPNGSGAAWYENSEKRMEGNWKNGVKDGLYSEWHDNGQQKMEANYEDGVVKGKPLYWAENGKRLRKKPPEVVVDIDDTDGSIAEPPKPKVSSKRPKILSAKRGGEGYYLRYLGMISIPKDTVWTSSTFDGTPQKYNHDIQLDGGFAIGAAFGRDFGIYRAELECTYCAYEPSGITYHLPPPLGTEQDSAGGNMILYSLLLNNSIDLEVSPNMEIYGGGGVGIAYSSMDLYRRFPTYPSSSGLKFAYQLLTGLNYNLAGYHNLTGGYKYLSSGDISPFEGIKSHNFEFGYRLDL